MKCAYNLEQNCGSVCAAYEEYEEKEYIPSYQSYQYVLWLINKCKRDNFTIHRKMRKEIKEV